MNESAASTTPIRWMRRLCFFVAVVMLAALVGLSLAYLASPIFFDHVEAHFAAVSWYFLHGMPLYNGPHDGETYTLPYGPFAYLVQGLLQESLGPSIFSSKLGGIVTINLALLATYFLFRKYTTRTIASTATGFMAAYWIGVCYLPLSSRADTYLILFVIMGLWAAMRPSLAGALLLGISLGICLNLKIHSPLYFLPIAGVAAKQGMGWGKLCVAGALAALLFILPFVLVPTVSIKSFLWFLGIMAHQGHPADLVLKNLVWLGVALGPVVAIIGISFSNNAALTRKILWEYRLPLFGILVTAPLLLVMASKAGAGPPHLMPFATDIVFVGLLLRHAGLDVSWHPAWPAKGACFVLCLSLFACFGYGFFKIEQGFVEMGPQPAAAAKSNQLDLEDILHRRGADYLLIMGVGDKASFPETYYHALLVFNGMPLGITPQPVLDWKMAGAPVKPDLGRLRETLAQSHPGKSIVWLIPKGTAPFSYVFDAEFRSAFAKAYTLRETTPHFDLYFERAVAP